MSAVEEPWRKPLLLLAAGALVVGILVRFKGLAYAPFSVDEYYLAQSIGGVMRSGLPAFTCGGFYTRGLVIQYLAAGLQFAGLSAELAPRLICALSSLAALPAAYLLGRRLLGRSFGYLLVALLALSVWEIEMARFGRMYAPFQAISLWYLVFFLRYALDREARAWRYMLALSIAGPFVWEGGIFLLLANLLPPFMQDPGGRLPAREWRRPCAALLLLGLCYVFLTHDFRGMDSHALPAGFDRSVTKALISRTMASGCWSR
jgi:hypothetical protein